jgi:hypothetical protein
MKAIEPIQYTPYPLIATEIRVTNNDDNLESQCAFYWWLFTADNTLVDNGAVMCDGDNYTTWDGNREYPYQFVADKIGVVLI